MVNFARLSVLVLAACGLSACQTAMEQPTQSAGTAELKARDGSPAGMARLYDDGSAITVSVALQGMTPGVHAVHLHTTGNCSAADFTSAGGHLNPGAKQHGSLNPAGSHLGDLPNVTVDADGMGTASVTLSPPAAQALAEIFDADGTAVVVHEGADDYRSDPAGAAGSRVACGVMSRS